MALSLSKGSSETLVDSSNTPVSKLTVGVGWDKSSGGKKGLGGIMSRRKGIDLDLSALIYDVNNAGVRICGFDTLVLFGGAMKHTGDNKTGAGDGIDESIEIDLDSIPSNITNIVLCLNAFKKGVSFTNISGADCFLFEEFGSEQKQIGMFSVPIDSPNKSTIFMVRLFRGEGGSWSSAVINEMDDLDASSASMMLNAGKRFLTA